MALVTGASRGIGRAIAEAFAEAGADLAISARSLEALETCAGQIRAHGRRAEAFEADLEQLDQVQSLPVQVLERFGAIDVLVNVAGFNRRMPSVQMTEADWDSVIDVNLKASFFLAQAVGRSWIESSRFARVSERGKGKIINIGSLAGAIGFHQQAQYASAKAGLVGMTRVLSSEWAGHGICVNVLAPGYIDTELTEPIWRDPERSSRVLGRIPAGAPGQVRDIALAAIYLASPASDYVSGQVLFVDGGAQAS